MSDHPTPLGGTCSASFEPPRELFAAKKLSEKRRNAACMKEVVSNRAVSERRTRSYDHGTPQRPPSVAGHHLGGP